MKKSLLVVSALSVALMLGASAFAATSESSSLKNGGGQKSLGFENRLENRAQMDEIMENGDYSAFVELNSERAKLVDEALFLKMTQSHKLRSEIRAEMEKKALELGVEMPRMGNAKGMGKGGKGMGRSADCPLLENE